MAAMESFDSGSGFVGSGEGIERMSHDFGAHRSMGN